MENKHKPNESQTSTINPLNPKLRTAYGPKSRLAISFPATGRTKQSFKDECDINQIMGRYAKTGLLSWVNNRTPIWGDTTGLDFQAAMELIVSAKAQFAALPSEIRDRFANDPARMLAFLEDAKNDDEAIRLGLKQPRGGQGRGALPPTEGRDSGPPDQSSGHPAGAPTPTTPPKTGG